MVVLGNEDITSAFSSSSSSSSSESESGCDVQPLEGDLLMVRRLMGSVLDYWQVHQFIQVVIKTF